MENTEGDTEFEKNSVDTSSAVNSLILDYYKKFGRKRDLEQFFSLSTAQGEVRDPAGTFWRKMKSENDSSDSVEKKSESSAELCRISITCSVPEPHSFQKRDKRDRQKSESESPPIITEELDPVQTRESDGESVKSEDFHSQRSNDATLDTSMNKPHSPTSSITSQRKLEWDSLADVGYANESDRKNSASSLSTLERLALKQQYSHNDSKQNIDLGAPTSHSTPLEETETKYKGKKGSMKKTTKICQKDVDVVELNVPHSSQTNLPQAISVNLTKQISFNVEKDGAVNIDNIKKNISVSPEKVVETEKQIQEKLDKEIQTSLLRNKNQSSCLTDTPENVPSSSQKFPVIMSLNTLKKKHRKKKLRIARKKLRNKNKAKVDNIAQEKTTEQISEAESFEYMPGHIYNQNHMKINQSRETHVGNKSSLESSVVPNTDSSKGSTFARDLEKSIDFLKTTFQKHHDDSTLKKKLIKEVVQRLIKSKYKDDESSTDFLSGLSFGSKTVVGEGNTTSTSDTNNTVDKSKFTRPKKSILRTENFNSNVIASSSQSAPNLPSISNSGQRISSQPIILSNTDSDLSCKEKVSSNRETIGTSSEELYKKYLEALRREEAYKKHIRDKENLFKQKLFSSETAVVQIAQADLKRQNKLKSLINDLTRNNYDDGSGDASKLEGHSNSDFNMDPYAFINKPRSHSVFTLSSANSDSKDKLPSSKNRKKNAVHGCNADYSKNDPHYCCCPYHSDHAKVRFTDSSVQVDIQNDDPPKSKTLQGDLPKESICSSCKKESPTEVVKTDSDSEPLDLKYVCMCSDGVKAPHRVPEKFLIYKCSQLVNKGVQLGDNQGSLKSEDNESNVAKHVCCGKKEISKPKIVQQRCTCSVLESKREEITIPLKHNSKSSQTNVNLNQMLQRKSSVRSVSSQSTECSNFINIHDKKRNEVNIAESEKKSSNVLIHEAVRSVQTEISINPKLSDPCLSDINIIDNNECVKLICEQFKEVPTTVTENNSIDHANEKEMPLLTESCCLKNQMSSVENKEKSNVVNDYIIQLDKEIQSDLEPIDNVQETNIKDQFTIPIYGTNMTLKVNLGSKCTDNMNPPNTTKSQGIVTDRQNVVEQFTSLRDDCTKSVQCLDPNLKTEPFDTNQQIQDKSIKNKACNDDKQKGFRPKDNCCAVNICSLDKPQFNTYPKEVNVRKPLLRTNTDISKFEGVDFQINLQDYKKTAKCQGPCNSTGVCDDQNVGKVDQKVETEKIRFNATTQPEKCCRNSSARSSKADDIVKKSEEFQCKPQPKLPTSDSESFSELDTNKDPLVNLIQDITKRYTKKDIERSKRKKCFKEIMTVLNYLLDTEDSTDEQNKQSSCISSTTSCQKQDKFPQKESTETEPCSSKTFVDKGVQLGAKKVKSNKCRHIESPDVVSTEFPTTSSDSATCKVLNKIKKECEKFHQKRCKSHNGLKTCDTSTTTSVNCDQCRRVHHCYCLRHKCRSHKQTEKPKKKCVAYNLILQTSDSAVSEDIVPGNNRVPLKSIIVKVPSKRKQVENVPFKEMAAKFEKNIPHCNPCSPPRGHRSRSLPNESEISSTEEFIRKAQTCTVKEYLERNRPDFVENSSKRQNCLKFVNETSPELCPPPYMKMVVVRTQNCTNKPCMDPCNMYCGGGVTMTCNQCMDPYSRLQNEVKRNASEREAKRKLLSLQMDRQQVLSAMTNQELHYFAKRLSDDLRRKKVAPKFINEREMKKHSEKIYKSLPEVTRKKEELKKEHVKKTNLLMANIFKKNLQKRTLRGSVNVSNYSSVIKI